MLNSHFNVFFPKLFLPSNSTKKWEKYKSSHRKISKNKNFTNNQFCNKRYNVLKTTSFL